MPDMFILLWMKGFPMFPLNSSEFSLKTLPPCAQLADCMEEGLLQDAREAAGGFAMFQASWEAAKSVVNPQAKREYDWEELNEIIC